MNDDSVFTGCLIPLGQAIITGVFVGILAASVAQYYELEPALIGLAAGALAGLAWWLTGIIAWRRVQFPTPIEQRPHETPRRLDPVRVELSRENGLDLIDLPAKPAQLITLAEGLLSGASLSEAAWTGTGGLFTRAEFANLRNELIKRGLAAWNNPHTPARGVTLTAPGRAVMRRFAAMSPSPAGMRLVKRRD